MKEFLIYTGMRIGLFVSSLVVVVGVWMLVSAEVPILWAVVVAFVVSGVGSYFLLNGPREALARRVEERAGRLSTRYDAMKTKEDVD